MKDARDVPVKVAYWKDVVGRWVQQLRKQCLAPHERQCGDVDAAIHEQVKHTIPHGVAAFKPAAPARSGLQAIEVGPADLVQHADLAIRHAGPLRSAASDLATSG